MAQEARRSSYQEVMVKAAAEKAVERNRPPGPQALTAFLDVDENFEITMELPRALRIKRAPWWLRWYAPHVIR